MVKNIETEVSIYINLVYNSIDKTNKQQKIHPVGLLNRIDSTWKTYKFV